MRAYDFDVQLFAESAVVIHKAEMCGRRSGRGFAVGGETMHVFVKRAGQWQVVLTHEGRGRLPPVTCKAR